MTAALECGKRSAARPDRTLPPGKTRYPFYRRLGGPQGRSGREENLVPTGIRSRAVQPVVSHYTDWATQPTKEYVRGLSIDKFRDYAAIFLSALRSVHQNQSSAPVSFMLTQLAKLPSASRLFTSFMDRQTECILLIMHHHINVHL